MTALPTPPMLYGQSAEELVEVRRYLFRLVEQLNLSLNNLDSGNFSPGTTDTLARFAEAMGGKTLTDEERSAAGSSAGALRDLIIKNADIVRQTMDRMSTDLHSNYVAESEFGTFQQEVDTSITALGTGVELAVNTASTVSTAFNTYKTDTEGYIRQGIVEHTEEGTPIIGIAIGQKITSESTETVDGKTYPVIDVKENMSVWTTERLSFYIGNGTSAREVAYFSGDRLYVNEVSTGAMTIGGNWRVDDTYGYTITWIGG